MGESAASRRAWIRAERRADAQVDALFAKAEANALGSPPRKHHIVPDFYLSRWADRGRVRRTDTTSRRTVVLATRKALKRTDFYRLESPDLDPGVLPPLLLETILSDIEGNASRIIDDLLHGRATGGGNDREMFAFFVALQHTRGMHSRALSVALATDWAKVFVEDMTDEDIRRQLRDRGEDAGPALVAAERAKIDALLAGETTIAPQPPASAGMAANAAVGLVQGLMARRWHLFNAPTGGLITCDEPVVAVPGPETTRRRLVGVEYAAVVLFPLSPNRLLAMFHPLLAPNAAGGLPDLSPAEVHAINVEIAANSYEHLIEHPRIKTTLTLPVGPSASDKIVPETLGEDGFSVHFPSRWRYTANPPNPPIERWW